MFAGLLAQDTIFSAPKIDHAFLTSII